ncbi:tyrosine-type recombinase/integrase [Actinoallomurus vinaceus]|uniref:Tyrosine-type recombinase/integrase n=1 Tax=Actinoallomurus vinaceus TaxID=1080074 RepID=A0ABP8UM24_9ACTN
MASGRTFKRCSCRDTETGRRLETKCPKLRRADGQWNPRHGSWSYQLELPPTLDGKRRNPLRRGGFTSQTVAEDDLSKAQELLAISNDRRLKNKITDFVLDTVKKMGELPDADTVRNKVRTGQQLNRNILLGDWLDIWLEGKKKITETTKNRYASDVRLYLKPHLGHIPVAELRVADISEMFDAIEEYNDLIRETRSSNDPTLRAKVKWRRVVNPPTLRNIRATLRHALTIAMKQERLIDFNPAAIVELPPATRPKPLVWTDERVRAWQTAHRQHLTAVRERANGKRINVIEAYIGTPRPSPVMVWTPEQTSRFLQRATRHRLYPLFRLIALRGLRRGEACGIQTTSVDLKNGTIAVCWQITQLGWNPHHGKPKSDAGDRIIDLDEETIKILRAHRAKQNRERLAAGLGESEFFFTDENGDPLHPARVTDQFQWLAYEIGLPPIRLHDLRHGAASLMLAAGVDIKIVQHTLGHVTSAFTRDTYTSVYPKIARDAAEDTAALIAPGTTAEGSRSGRAPAAGRQ